MRPDKEDIKLDFSGPRTKGILILLAAAALTAFILYILASDFAAM